MFCQYVYLHNAHGVPWRPEKVAESPESRPCGGGAPPPPPAQPGMRKKKVSEISGEGYEEKKKWGM